MALFRFDAFTLVIESCVAEEEEADDKTGWSSSAIETEEEAEIEAVFLCWFAVDEDNDDDLGPLRTVPTTEGTKLKWRCVGIEVMMGRSSPCLSGGNASIMPCSSSRERM